MKFEDILSELRKGRKARRPTWHRDLNIAKIDRYLDFRSGDGGAISHPLTHDDILADDWELVPEEKKHVRWIGLFSDGDSSIHDKQEHVYRYAELYAKKMEPLKSPALVEVRKIEWKSE